MIDVLKLCMVVYRYRREKWTAIGILEVQP
jgi:hypothetical protein